MDDRIKKLYEKVIHDGENLTTKELNDLGYNAKSINDLIKDGFIKRIKRGHYIFLNVNGLHLHGKYLLHQDRELAYKCFRRCLEIDPQHGGAIYSLFFDAIFNRRYDEAISYLKVLRESGNVNYQKDYNCYLFLLNFICDLPEEYKSIVDSMEVNDLLVNEFDKRYSDIAIMNEIRKSIFNTKFAYASINIQEFINGDKKKQSTDILIRKLLYEAHNNLIATLKELWGKGKYDEFIELLEIKQDKYALSRLEYSYLYLAKSYVSMFTSRSNKPKKEVEGNTIFSYIMANEFDKTFEKMSNNKGRNDELLLILLTDICKLENNLRDEEKTVEKNTDLLTDLFNSLLVNDMPLVEEVLKKYLKSIRHEDYFTVVMNHIKLCVLDGDLTFTKPMSILVQLKKDIFNVDLDYYKSLMQEYIDESNLDAAKLVLEIIIHLNKNSKVDVERKITTNEVKVKVEDKKTTDDLPNKNNNIKISSYLQMKYQELLRDKGLVLFSPMNLQEREKLIKEICTLPDVTFFIIGDVEPKRVVLHYTPELDRYIDAKELMRNLRNKYSKRKYKEVVDDCKELLCLRKVRSYTCFRIGMAYRHLGEYQKAIDYLIIAQELSKKDQKKPYDFSEKIKMLYDEAEKIDESIKLYVDVKLDEFNLSAVDTDFEAIKDAVLVNGHDARSICYYLGYNDNQMARVLLLLSRECFMNGSVDKGESYIKLFEKMPGKSKENIELAEEVKRNKKLYINGGATLVRFRSNINEDS